LLSLATRNDWPGVADPDEIELWNAICPNPAALLNLADEKIASPMIDEDQVLDRRQRDFAANLKLSYRDPIMLLRGWRHYLFDQWGRPYLDAYNNVPHVGHAHPRIQSVVSRQWSQLNTNTRYLHPSHSAFAARLQSKLPNSLSVCYFVNSGSEANELALRLSRAHTGAKDIITPDHGYHGNTTGAIDISAYKFNAAGGVGQADWVHLVDIPDSYAGTYRHPQPDCASYYAKFHRMATWLRCTVRFVQRVAFVSLTKCKRALVAWVTTILPLSNNRLFRILLFLVNLLAMVIQSVLS